MSRTAKVNITINRGSTFRHTFAWLNKNKTPINLAGYTARMHIRQDINSSKISANLTTENGGILIDPAKGEISLHLLANFTSTLILLKGVYDLEIISPSGEVKRLVEGIATISPEVTRA